jgi:hypothetical protein
MAVAAAPETRVPAPAPDFAAWRRPPWRTHRMVGRQVPGGAGERAPSGTKAPPDGEDFALHPAALIIGHVADRRGSARQE